MELERDQFEEVVLAHFVAQRAAGVQISGDNGCEPTRESLFWRDDKGDYGVRIFNAAWWGWKEAAVATRKTCEVPPMDEALQAEHTDEVMRGLMLEKAHAMGLAERDAALARLAGLEAQFPAIVSALEWGASLIRKEYEVGHNGADSYLMNYSKLGERVRLSDHRKWVKTDWRWIPEKNTAAGASSATEGKMGEALGIAEGCSGSMPTSQPWSKHPNPVHHVNTFPTEHLRDVVEHARVLHARVEAWVTDAQSGVFVTCPVSLSTGASPVEPSQAQPEPVNVGLMELLEPAFTEIQHVLGSTLEVPYQRKSLETALELVRAAIAVIKQSQPDYEAMHKKGFQAFDCPVCGFDGALGFQPAAQPSQAPLTDAEIEKLREKTFSTNNPFCPVDSKSMRKAVRAAEAAHGIKQGDQHD